MAGNSNFDSMDDTSNDNSQQQEDDLFYFESDYVALRGNKDYSDLIKTLFILTAQREKALKDYEKICEIKTSALEDPGLFLKKLKTNSLDIPPLQCIPQIPFINWYGYNTKIPEWELKTIYNDQTNETNGNNNSARDETKSTHKQPWSSEEQKRLEELLVLYPPEPIENRRIRKIAAALGNRTMQQVSSRLQKYYLKLQKAGLQIPGRPPKNNSCTKKRNKHKHNIWKPTTFFPEYNVPVFMDENESAPGPSNAEFSKKERTNSNNHLLGVDYNPLDSKSKTELQLILLKRIRAEKVKESQLTEPYRHLTYRCDYCNEEPIVGTRWHCYTCVKDSVDFCTDCLLTQLYSSNKHPLTHNFVTLPHSDDPNFKVSSDSDSESANSNNDNDNDNSDSDISERSSLFSHRSKGINNSNARESYSPNISSEKNGLKHSSEETAFEEFRDLTYKDEINDDAYSTQDIGYSYLHSTMKMNENE